MQLIRLKEYQKRTVCSVLEKFNPRNSHNTDGVVIADEVGLGKTFEVFGIIEKLRSRNKRILIIVPSRDVARHWIEQFKKYTDNKSGFLTKQSAILNKISYRSRIAGNQKLIRSNLLKPVTFRPAKGQCIFLFSGREFKSQSLSLQEKIYILESKCHQRRGVKTLIDKKIRRRSWKIYGKTINLQHQRDSTVKKVFEHWLKKNEQISNRELKAALIQAVIRKKLRPNIIVVDEFHNYPEFRDKEKFEKSNWRTILHGNNIRSNNNKFRSKIRKIYLSATPFKPLGVSGSDNMDIISPVLNNLILKYKENNEIKENNEDGKISNLITNYNKLVLELREKIKNKDVKEIQRVINELKIDLLKKKVEKYLRNYIIENRRKVDTHRWGDKESRGKGQVDSKKNFHAYLEYHRKIFESQLVEKGKKRFNMMNLPQAEQMFTAGWETLFESNDLKLPNKIFNFSNKNKKEIKKTMGIYEPNCRNKCIQHQKIRKFFEIVSKCMFLRKKSLLLWIPFGETKRSIEKFVTYCFFRKTPIELEDKLKEYYHLDFKHGDKSKIIKFSAKNKKYAFERLRNLFDENPRLPDNEEFIKPLFSYLTSPYAQCVIGAGTGKQRGLNFVRKILCYSERYKLKETIREYLDGSGDRKALIETLENIHMPVYKYGTTHGGGKKKKNSNTREIYDERLRKAFNTPFFPLGLISTNIGAEGIDLHRYCRNVIHYDVWWMPSRLEQRVGRIDRVNSLIYKIRKSSPDYNKDSQKGKVLDSDVEIYLPEKGESEDFQIREFYMTMKDTVDEYILERALERKIWTSLLIGGSGLERLIKGEGQETEEIRHIKPILDRLKLDFSPKK